MKKIEQDIIKLIKIIYNINEKQEKEITESFPKISNKDKEEFFNTLIKAYNNNRNILKSITKKMEKLENQLSEFEENIGYEKILDEL